MQLGAPLKHRHPMPTLSKSQRGGQSTKTAAHNEDREDGLCVARIGHFEIEIVQDSVFFGGLVENHGVFGEK